MCWDIPSFFHRSEGNEAFHVGPDVFAITQACYLARVVEVLCAPEQRCDGHVGDGIVTCNPSAIIEAFFNNVQQTFDAVQEAIARTLVLDVFAAKAIEEAEFASHRAKAAHPDDQPLLDFPALGIGLVLILARFLGQITEDRTAFGQPEQFYVRTIRINDRGDLDVGFASAQCDIHQDPRCERACIRARFPERR